MRALTIIRIILLLTIMPFSTIQVIIWKNSLVYPIWIKMKMLQKMKSNPGITRTFNRLYLNSHGSMLKLIMISTLSLMKV